MSDYKGIKKYLAFDCETTGFAWGEDDPSTNYQMISGGFIVADENFNPIEELYVEFKYDGVSRWEWKAEQVHGLSREYLAANGLDPEDAALKIAVLLDKHFDVTVGITLLGTNVMSFDVFFLRKFLRQMDLPFRFNHRAADTFSLAIGTVGTQTSDELFELLGFKKRDAHNALEDIRMSLKSFQIINKLWNKHVG